MMKKTLLAFCLMLVFAAPASAASLVRENAVWYRLHFGTGVAKDAPLPEAIHEFIDTFVTERFPEGMTITLSHGQWSVAGKALTKERTVIVDIQCDDSDDNWSTIRKIADEYIKRFAASNASCFIKRVPGITTILYYNE